MKDLKKFIKLDKKELENSLIEDSVAQLNRAIQRKRMDLEDAIVTKKAEVSKVSTITRLDKLNVNEWVDSRNEALNELKLAEKELEIFNINFPQ